MAPGEDRSHADGATDALSDTSIIAQPSVAYGTYVELNKPHTGRTTGGRGKE